MGKKLTTFIFNLIRNFLMNKDTIPISKIALNIRNSQLQIIKHIFFFAENMINEITG